MNMIKFRLKKRLTTLSVLCVLGLVVGGCSLTKGLIDEEDELKVSITDQPPENCRALGNIQHTQQSFFTNSGNNIRMEQATRIILQNKAVARGGDTLYILPDPTGRLQQSDRYGSAARKYTRTFIATVYQCQETTS